MYVNAYILFIKNRKRDFDKNIIYLFITITVFQNNIIFSNKKYIIQIEFKCILRKVLRTQKGKTRIYITRKVLEKNTSNSKTSI